MSVVCGIYLLEFSGTDKVYVGQAVNIEKRYREHLRSFKTRTANHKLMNAFDEFGAPKLNIVLECSQADLNTNEMEAFDIFNSINDGFNIAKYSDIFQSGDKNPSSKYPMETIRLIFKDLLDPANSFKALEIKHNVPESLIRHISRGEAHTWLKEEFPEEYPQLREIINSQARRKLNGCAKARGKVYPKIIKDGVIKEVESLAEFARQHNLDPSYLGKVLRGQALSIKGWKVYCPIR